MLNLCFHGIGAPGRSLEAGEARYWVEGSQFDEMLAVIRCFPTIRITFDDGNVSDIAHALPALLRTRLAATFFVVAARLDQPGSLTRRDVSALARAGMGVGSHGLNHRPWRSLSDKELALELGDATGSIADAARQPITEVACPFGSYDRRVLKAVRRHGFSRVYTVDGGPAKSGDWLQPRHTVRSSDTPADIERLGRASRGTAAAAAVRGARVRLKRWR